MVVINIKEIPRPTVNTDPSRYTESERQGLALIYLISAIARETAFGLPRNAVKMLIFDEAWVMASISEGERLLDELIRIGRSYNLIPVLISQNITDLEKPVFINNSSQVFCFRALSAEETKAGLRILGADEEAVPPETFAKLQPGVCLFRDNENRIGWLQVEVKPDYLVTDIFNSKPDAQLEELRATLQ
jgi:DNA helicase HerA-like ATPase